MTIPKITDIPLSGKRVFLRADLNAPLTASREVADDSRLRAVLPTIQYCVEQGARLVIASHLGRPKGKINKKLSLEPVAKRLAELLDGEIYLTDEPIGDGAKKVVSDLRDGQIAMLENLRFNPGESSNESGFAKTLASYADVYLNDAFGTAHRAHASTVGMVDFVPEKAAGFLIHREIEFLTKLIGTVDRPYVAIIGGAKVSGKIEVLEALLEKVNTILIGGAMANTFLASNGLNTGKSLIEEEKMATARLFLRRASDQEVTVLLPSDVVLATSLDSSGGTIASVENIGAEDMALDIGPVTAERYQKCINDARTIFWNGPMGVFEKPSFAKGTLAIAQAVANNSRALSVVGGGDSAAAVVRADVGAQISHVSTGGGASLEFIQGRSLPGLVALEKE